MVTQEMALFQYFFIEFKVDGNYPGTNLTDPPGAPLKEVHVLSSSISKTNTKIEAIPQPSAAGPKAVRRTYLQINVEKKA